MKFLSFVVLFVVVAIAFGQPGRGRPQNGPLGGRGNKDGSQDYGRDREGRGHRHNSRSSSSSSSEEHRSRPTGATASNRPVSSATGLTTTTTVPVGKR